METINKAVQNALTEIGYRGRIILLSVLVPGILIFFEGLSSWYFKRNPNTNLGFFSASAEYVRANILFSVFLMLLILAASFATGFIFREIAFSLSNATMKLGFFRSDSLPGVIERVRLVYGADRVNRVLQFEEIFSCVTKESEIKLRSPRSADFYMRNFCKLWLRTRVPALSVDYLESEINIFISFVLPTAFAAFPLIMREWTTFDIGDFCVVAAILLGAALMLAKINGVRWYETEVAITNYVLANGDLGPPELRSRAKADLACSKSIVWYSAGLSS